MKTPEFREFINKYNKQQKKCIISLYNYVMDMVSEYLDIYQKDFRLRIFKYCIPTYTLYKEELLNDVIDFICEQEKLGFEETTED